MTAATVPSRRAAFSTLGEPAASLERIVELARGSGITGIELRSAEGELAHRGIGAEERAAVKDGFAAAGIELIGLNSYVRLCAPADDGEQLDGLLGELALAADLGARGVRVFMCDESGDGTGERRARERLERAHEESARLGVPVLIETHDSHSRGRGVADFIAGLDADTAHTVGVIWDTAHTWTHGESPAESLAALAPHLAYLQLKDHAARATPVPVALGAGQYPIAELSTALDDAAWGGWVSLEWERTWHPELAPLADALAALPAWAEPVLHGSARQSSADDSKAHHDTEAGER
jgi:sugar phosphate isomerase/epimerase